MITTDSFILYIITIIIFLGIISTIPLTIRYKKHIPEHDLPIWLLILLYYASLIPIGLILAIYMIYRKKKYDNIKRHKFSLNVRDNSRIMIIVFMISFLVKFMYLFNKYY